MRISVIRGDTNPIAILDLEPTSQQSPGVEPKGQNRRFGRPDSTAVTNAIGAMAAAVTGSVTITTLTVSAPNNVLKVKTVSGGTSVTITVAAAAYATPAALVAAINTAAAGTGISAVNVSGKIQLRSTSGYILVDTTANGSTLNTALGFTDNQTFSRPTAAAVILATSPVGGPVDVSSATLKGLLGGAATDADVARVVDTIAPKFIETTALKASYLVGHIAGYRASTYNPDPHRLPALTPGAAIALVQDDGTTAYTVDPTAVSGVTASGGALTITGTSLGDAEIDRTVVRVTAADGVKYVRLYQSVIQDAGGTVSAASIVLPSTILNGLGIAGSKVQVQYLSFASAVVTAS